MLDRGGRELVEQDLNGDKATMSGEPVERVVKGSEVLWGFENSGN